MQCFTYSMTLKCLQPANEMYSNKTNSLEFTYKIYRDLQQSFRINNKIKIYKTNKYWN